MRWLGKHGAALSGLFLTALFIYLQLVVWKKHGDDLMLTAASIVVTCSLWMILLLAIVRYWRHGADIAGEEAGTIDARPIIATETHETAFAYLPGSPLSNGWSRAYGICRSGRRK
jgi:hypothetical protein